MREISTLSGRGSIIRYQTVHAGYEIQRESARYILSNNMIQAIMREFFTDQSWRPLGASEDRPMIDGLGFFLKEHFSISPRYASAIAAVLVDVGVLEFHGKRPIWLRKLPANCGR